MTTMTPPVFQQAGQSVLATRGSGREGGPGAEALAEVYAAARRFVATQRRADASARPTSLAEAIERDFLLFDLHEAGRDLRDAVEAADSGARGAAGGWHLGASPPLRARAAS